MHGLRPEVDLGFLIGKVIEQVAVGLQSVQINYESGGITIEHKCRLKHPTLGELEWQGSPEDAAQIVSLVSSRITGFAPQADGTLMLRFSNGALLTIFDNQDRQAYSIAEHGRRRIVV